MKLQPAEVERIRGAAARQAADGDPEGAGQALGVLRRELAEALEQGEHAAMLLLVDVVREQMGCLRQIEALGDAPVGGDAPPSRSIQLADWFLRAVQRYHVGTQLLLGHRRESFAALLLDTAEACVRHGDLDEASRQLATAFAVSHAPELACVRAIEIVLSAGPTASAATPVDAACGHSEPASCGCHAPRPSAPTAGNWRADRVAEILARLDVAGADGGVRGEVAALCAALSGHEPLRLQVEAPAGSSPEAEAAVRALRRLRKQWSEGVRE